MIRIGNQNIDTGEVRNHVSPEKVVTQLGLIWKDRVHFVLSKDFTLKKIHFSDEIQEEVTMGAESVDEIQYASQLIMAHDLSQILNELQNELDGFVTG